MKVRIYPAFAEAWVAKKLHVAENKYSLLILADDYDFRESDRTVNDIRDFVLESAGKQKIVGIKTENGDVMADDLIWEKNLHDARLALLVFDNTLLAALYEFDKAITAGAGKLKFEWPEGRLISLKAQG